MRTSTAIPRHLQDAVDRELEQGERVVWIDMPIPRFFTPAATAAFLFAIPWTAFAVFWIAGAAWGTSQTEGGAGVFSFFPFFGLPFVLIGLAMLSCPLWAHRKAFKTVYVITDRRAITFDGGWSTTIRSYPPDKLQDVYRNEKKDGSGDVVISRQAWRDSENDHQSTELGFLRIRNPKEVELMLRKLAEQAQAASEG